MMTGSGNKFDCGVVVVLLGIATHFQTQPFQASFVAIQTGGPSTGMPGFKQIVEFVLHKSRVTGLHQGKSIGCQQALWTTMPAFTTCGITSKIAARARCKSGMAGFFHNLSLLAVTGTTKKSAAA